MTTIQPTGRTRHRLQKRPFSPALLVLQVEVREFGAIPTHGGKVDINRNFWRDATLEDITVEVPT